MIRNVIGSLFRKTACARYPRLSPKIHPASRGRIALDPSLCVLCSLCVKRCIASALAVDRPGRTWTIDRLRCIFCLLCVEACPQGALRSLPEHCPPSGSPTAPETVSIPAPVADPRR
jgi:formate hydrogenlyase subunit 6/NADH:ubiquinone oxidoreductase subunit I